MYCKNCGEELKENAVMCSKCGCFVDEEEKQEITNEKNGMALAGFIFSFLMPLFGWIFGGIGLSKAKEYNGKGKGLSIAAIIISTVNFLISFYLLCS